jgi:glycosyltransferase involved in cell wall biosynthesis
MFSVVIPVYNSRTTLPRTVASVLAQTFTDFELIVVDDGSTDSGVATLPQPLDPRIVVLRQPNAGEGAARNRGIAAARHEWVAFLDADDIWLPDHLAELDRIRRRCPQARLIGTGTIESDFNGRYSVPASDGDPAIELIPFFERMAAEPRPLSMSSVAIDRAAIDDVGGFGSFTYGPDTELFARIALRHPVAASTRPTAVYLRNTDGVSARGRTRWKRARLRSPADISPCVATLLRHCAEHGPEAAPPGVDAFVDLYIGYCLRTSARIGDVDTIRALRPMYRRRPTAEDRVLLAVGLLPGRVARRVARPASLLSRVAGRALRRPRPAAGRGSSRPAQADP